MSKSPAGNEYITIDKLADLCLEDEPPKLVDMGHNGEDFTQTFELPNGERVEVSIADLWSFFL